MITIIDYGVGNLASVQNMLKKNGFDSLLTNDPKKISMASKLILPGVGAYDSAMKKINAIDLKPAILEAAHKGTFVLGICLGSQILFDGSDEGVLSGLSLIKGSCKKFDADAITPLRVPHMGWSDVTFTVDHPLFNFDNLEPRFYFTHSYHFICANEKNVAGTAVYGKQFTCAVMHENIFGVQFHPEKSHRFGSRLLQNFASL
jgi:glutamine amidotransferase